MRTLSHDTDLVVSDGNLVMADGVEAIRQQVEQALRWWLGEWFLRLNEGVPYESEIFQRPASLGLISVILTDRALSVDGVDAVTDVRTSIDPQTREMRWSATVRTDFGSIAVIV